MEIIDDFMDVERCALMDVTLERLNGVQGVVLSGAPILITEVDPEKYLEKLAWIKETKTPVLGICFGHQLIGMLFGAFPSRMKEDRDWQTIESFVDSPLLNRLPNEFEMMEDHCETISIPPDFELIGSSDACVNEIMQHRTLPIYGVQFHPEVSGNHGSILLENFVNICLGSRYP